MVPAYHEPCAIYARARVVHARVSMVLVHHGVLHDRVGVVPVRVLESTVFPWYVHVLVLN